MPTGPESFITAILARAWIIRLACQKPTDVGWAPEFWFWSEELMARYVREHAAEAGHPSARTVQQGTVSKILAAHDLNPHRMTYYLQRRDPDFDQKMVQVLHVYQPGEFAFDDAGRPTVRFSYDEKPGIQALGNTAPEHPRAERVTAGPGICPPWHPQPVGGHRSRLGRDRGDGPAPASQCGIRGIPEGPGCQISRGRENPSGLGQPRGSHLPGNAGVFGDRAESVRFCLYAEAASWLNLIEMFFAKLTKQLLHGIRARPREELQARILAYLVWLNEDPVPFQWRWKPDQPEDAHVI